MSRPCLVVGLGDIGWRVAAACREAYRYLPEPHRLPASFLGIDLRNGQAEKQDEDLVLLSAADLREVLAHLDTLVDGKPAWSAVHDWFPDRQRFAHVPDQPEGTGQARPLGRLSLWIHSHTELVRGALRRRLEDLCSRSSHGDRRPDVILIASACGGTGSALIFDVASLIRKLTAVGRQDFFLALPYSDSLDELSLQNTYATLVDITLAARFPQRDIKAITDPTVETLADTAESLSPFVLLRPAAKREAVVKALAEIVTARLRRSLANAIAEWRQRFARVHFLPRPIRGLTRLHTNVSTSLPLVRIERLRPNLEDVLNEELVEQGLEPSKPIAVDESDPEPTLQEFEQEVRTLIHEHLEKASVRTRLESLQVEVSLGPDGGKRKSASLADKFRAPHPLLEAPAQVRSSKDLKNLLDALGISELYSRLQTLASRFGQTLGKMSTECLEPLLADYLQRLIQSLPETASLDPRYQEWQRKVEEMQRFEDDLDWIPVWRRIPMASRLRHRNRQIRERLIAESIDLHGWQQAIEPAIQIGALRLLEEHLPSRWPASATDNKKKPGQSSPEPAAAAPVKELASEREREAIRYFIRRHKQGAPADGEVTSATMRSLLENSENLFIPDPSAGSLEDAITACKIEAFTARVDFSPSRVLIALLPEGLIWPEGEAALQQTIERHARKSLGAPAQIVRGPSDRIVFYLEEGGQPLQNLESLDLYQRAYLQHPHPTTLHIDRRWIESEDGRHLLADLQLDKPRPSDVMTSRSNDPGEDTPHPTH